MLDPGMTAGLLEERLMRVEEEMPDDKLLPAAMRSAMRHLREADITILTKEEVRAFAGILETGAEVACYMETYGYYRPEGCIVYAMRDPWVWVTTSNGEAKSLHMADYNRKWRLWEKYPGGTERHHNAWNR